MKKKNRERQAGVEAESIAFDFSGILTRTKKLRRYVRKNNAFVKVAFLVFLVLIPLFTSVYFRAYPVTLPVADDWAMNSIKGAIRSQVTAGLEQQWNAQGLQNIPSERKQELIQAEVAKVLEQQKDALEEQKKQVGDQFRSRMQDESGQTYLLAIDPYEFLRRTENMAETGDVCDEVREGVCWDLHKLAPLGTPATKDFHSSFSSWLYKFLAFFRKGVPVKNVFFYVPLIIASLAVIPAFFLARKAAGDVAGFIAAMLVALNTSFLGRTPAGFSDTDAYNVFFPLLILTLVIQALGCRNWKGRVAYSCFAGIFTGIFSFAWGGWWLVFLTSLAILLGVTAYRFLQFLMKLNRTKHGSEWKSFPETQVFLQAFAVLAMFFVFASVFIYAFGASPIGAFKSAVGETAIKQAAQASLWPNVLTTVAELNEASVTQIIGSFGSKLFFFLAIMALPLAALSKKLKISQLVILGSGVLISLYLISSAGQKLSITAYLVVLFVFTFLVLLYQLFWKENIDPIYVIFISVWIIFTMYPSTKGIRFIFLMLPAFAVAVGVAVGKFSEMMKDLLEKSMDIPSWLTMILIWAFVIMLLVKPIGAAHQVALNEVPSMNDAWVKTLEKIKDNSQEDAIINSWWDFGHWFKYWGG